jgi:intracellular septation protein A
LTVAPAHTTDRRRPDPGPLRGAATLLVDLVLPTALYYGLRAGGLGQVAALLLAGVPPAIRVGFVLARKRRIDSMGMLVLAALLVTALASLITGDPRTLLVRNALLGIPFGLWMLGSLWASRPLTYELAKSLLPNKEVAFEREWTDEPGVRRLWRRLTVLWAGGILLHAAASVVMAATLAVDVVPGLETGLWLAMFVVLQIITQVALFRTGTMRRIFSRAPERPRNQELPIS